MKTSVRPLTGNRSNLTYPYGNSTCTPFAFPVAVQHPGRPPIRKIKKLSQPFGLHGIFRPGSGRGGWVDLTQGIIGTKLLSRSLRLYVQKHISGCQHLAERTGTASGCGSRVDAEAKETRGKEVVVWLVVLEKMVCLPYYSSGGEQRADISIHQLHEYFPNQKYLTVGGGTRYK